VEVVAKVAVVWRWWRRWLRVDCWRGSDGDGEKDDDGDMVARERVQRVRSLMLGFHGKK